MYGRVTFIPTGAFFNQNDLSSAFLICCSMLLFMKSKIFSIAMLVVYFIMIAQGARFNVMVLTPFLLHHFIFKTGWIYKFIVITSIVLMISFVYIKLPEIGEIANRHITVRATSFGREAESQEIGSVRSRWKLYEISLEKLVHTYGLGVGIGNFEDSITPERLIDIGMEPVPPHNFFVEMLATEGIIAFILINIIVFSLILPIIRNERRKSILSLFNLKDLSEPEKRVMLFLLFFAVAVAIPSSIRGHLIYWSMLGYNYVLIYNRHEVYEKAIK